MCQKFVYVHFFCLFTSQTNIGEGVKNLPLLPGYGLASKTIRDYHKHGVQLKCLMRFAEEKLYFEECGFFCHIISNNTTTTNNNKANQRSQQRVVLKNKKREKSQDKENNWDYDQKKEKTKLKRNGYFAYINKASSGLRYKDKNTNNLK